MKDVILQAYDLARDVLKESLAELRYEAQNGLDRERVQRFTSLATRAETLLSSPVPPVERRESKPRAPKPASETQKDAVLRILRTYEGEVVAPSAFPIGSGKSALNTLSKHVIALRKEGHVIESIKNEGYMLLKGRQK